MAIDLSDLPFEYNLSAGALEELFVRPITLHPILQITDIHERWENRRLRVTLFDGVTWFDQCFLNMETITAEWVKYKRFHAPSLPLKSVIILHQFDYNGKSIEVRSVGLLKSGDQLKEVLEVKLHSALKHLSPDVPCIRLLGQMRCEDIQARYHSTHFALINQLVDNASRLASGTIVNVLGIISQVKMPERTLHKRTGKEIVTREVWLGEMCSNAEIALIITQNEVAKRFRGFTGLMLAVKGGTMQRASGSGRMTLHADYRSVIQLYPAIPELYTLPPSYVMLPGLPIPRQMPPMPMDQYARKLVDKLLEVVRSQEKNKQLLPPPTQPIHVPMRFGASIEFALQSVEYLKTSTLQLSSGSLHQIKKNAHQSLMFIKK